MDEANYFCSCWCGLVDRQNCLCRTTGVHDLINFPDTVQEAYLSDPNLQTIWWPHWDVDREGGDGFCSSHSRIWDEEANGFYPNATLYATTTHIKNYRWSDPQGEQPEPSEAVATANGDWSSYYYVKSSATGASAHANATFYMRVSAETTGPNNEND